jgi:hypothetical protein
MRVCQFRHFGTHEKSSSDGWTGSSSSVAKPSLRVKLNQGLACCDERSSASPQPGNHYHLRSKDNTPA